MPYLTIDDHLPLLVVRRVGAADAKSVSSMLDWTGQQFDVARGKVAWIYDAGESPGGLPDAAARRAGADWIARNRRRMETHCAGLDFAFASPLSRGALTAVFWIAKPPVPWTMHSTLAAAIDSALERLGRPSKLDAKAVLRDLARRPSVVG